MNRNIFGSPIAEDPTFGFRLPRVPEPATALLGMVGGAFALLWRRCAHLRVFVLACSLGMVCLARTSAHAAELNVLNPSFEDLTGPPNSTVFDSSGNLKVDNFTDVIGFPGTNIPSIDLEDPIPSWTTTGSDAGTVNPSYFLSSVKDGQNVAFIGGTIGGGIISQTLIDTLADGTYTLDVDVGNPGLIAYAGYDVQLLAGSTVLAEDDNTLSPAPSSFSTSVLTYHADSTDPLLGQNLTIRLTAITPGGGSQTDFDNVRLFHTVPEPGTLAIAILGSASLIVIVRRRKRSVDCFC